MTIDISGQTSIKDLTVDQLLKLLEYKSSGIHQLQIEKDQQFVYGLKGLSNILNCSRPTAQKIKNSGKIPYTQVGRKLIFNKDAVLSALKKNN